MGETSLSDGLRQCRRHHCRGYVIRFILALLPLSLSCCTNAADLLVMEKKWELAKAKYEQILKHDRHDNRALVALGELSSMR